MSQPASRAIALVIAMLVVPALQAADLRKDDAAELLTIMGNRNVVVAAVINDVGGLGGGSFSSDNVALVVGYAELNDEPVEIRTTFYYDRDLGWFFYQVDKENRRIRIWTTDGYQEMRPESPSSSTIPQSPPG
jgi:hypothetical protein